MVDTSPVIIGLAAGIALVVLFATMFASTTPIPDPRKQLEPITVFIIEGSSLESSGKTFVPQKARMVIGIDKVMWVNRDSVPAIVCADDDSDPDFYEATKDCVVIKPGESFDFAFTRPGEFSYHGRPWQHGTIFVVERFT